MHLVMLSFVLINYTIFLIAMNNNNKWMKLIILAIYSHNFLDLFHKYHQINNYK